jgi:hypothetical protein
MFSQYAIFSADVLSLDLPGIEPSLTFHMLCLNCLPFLDAVHYRYIDSF